MYKVWVLGVGESKYATNGLDFDTINEANSYGNDLLSRWFGAETFKILPKSDEFEGFLSQSVIDQNSVKL